MVTVLGLDLAPYLCGYSVGDGSRAPKSWAWQFDDFGVSYGKLGVKLNETLATLHTRWAFTHVAYEAPLLLDHDREHTLRRIYGLGVLVETWCEERGIPCIEEHPKGVKKAMTGDSFATKEVVADTAERVGIQLPPTKAMGRLDAADATGCWIVGLREWSPEQFAIWDAKLKQARGGLL